MKRFDVISLWCGVAIPIIYFGSVALGALFYPGFSFVRQFASELGANEAPHPQILNFGLMLLGIVSLLAVFGYWRALQRVGAKPILARWTCIVLTGFAIAMFMAGYFPMNDYFAHSGFGLSFLLLGGPGLLAAALSHRSDAKPLRSFLITTNILALVACFSNFAAKGPLQGLFQLTYTLVAIPWIGVGAYKLSRLSSADLVVD